MVLVIVFEFQMDRTPPREYILDIDLLSRTLPSSSKEVLDIITKWAGDIRDRAYKSGITYFNRMYHDLMYLFSELGRRKFYLATMPHDTNYFEHYVNKEREFSECELVDIFVDEGSPFKRIYWCKKGVIENNLPHYSITGLKSGGSEAIHISVTLRESLPRGSIIKLSKEEEEAIGREDTFLTTITRQSYVPTVFRLFLEALYKGVN